MRIDAFNSNAGNMMIIPQLPGTGQAVDFRKLFKGSIGEVNRLQANAEHLIEGVMAGQEIDPGIVATAVVKADTAFRMMIQIRNKLTEAFQELRQLRI